MLNAKKQSFYAIVSDILSIVLSYLLTLHFRFTLEEALPIYKTLMLWYNIIIAVVLYLSVYLCNNIYKNIIKYASIRYFIFFGLINACAGIMMVAISIILPPKIILTFKYNALAAIIIIFFTVGIRGMIRIISTRKETLFFKKRQKCYKNLLIIGAGSGAEWVIRSIAKSNAANYNIVGIIDDDENKKNKFVFGVKVFGGREKIVSVCREKNVDEILIAIPSLEDLSKQRIYSMCTETGLPVKTLPSINEIVETSRNSDATKHIRDVKIEDLLARKPIQLNNEQLHDEICGKVILVTGGGGSIGSELCRQILKHEPKSLIIFDIYENNAYDLQLELLAEYPDVDLKVVIASVRDLDKLEQVFKEYRPQLVFHAAAHKHVPLMEFNPGEAIKNNVFGTYNVAKTADKYKTERFILISTDKAVNPTNIMGATKRICEMIIQSMQEISKTEFVAVRFGNVLGSSGSVIPLFKKQIENRRPITVTHKDITRFFMTIPEAAQLVLQAACYAKGGEIFVLDMGNPIKIYDLALNLIRLSGLKPFEDIDIKIIGLRPGEKLYEELLMDEEGLKKTENSKIYIGNPIFINMETLTKTLEKLKTAMMSDDKEYIKDIVAQVVPTYIRKPRQNEQEKQQKSDKTAEA
ncbi:MAG: nucleoside-diphosphate sugar epimerase/dehydratase [Bacillota bacterium]|nr:nucleoside-diphosphate sugar epimerase/dehydratase [Bacillota bacterium]